MEMKSGINGTLGNVNESGKTISSIVTAMKNYTGTQNISERKFVGDKYPEGSKIFEYSEGFFCIVAIDRSDGTITEKDWRRLPFYIHTFGVLEGKTYTLDLDDTNVLIILKREFPELKSNKTLKPQGVRPKRKSPVKIEMVNEALINSIATLIVYKEDNYSLNELEDTSVIYALSVESKRIIFESIKDGDDDAYVTIMDRITKQSIKLDDFKELTLEEFKSKIIGTIHTDITNYLTKKKFW